MSKDNLQPGEWIDELAPIDKKTWDKLLNEEKVILADDKDESNDCFIWEEEK
jgi:hypothetical protein